MSEEQTRPPTIAEIVAVARLEESIAASLTAALVEREQWVADALRGTGATFNLEPTFVAEVIAEIGLGHPMEQTERDFIRQQFANRQAELQKAYAEATERPVLTYVVSDPANSDAQMMVDVWATGRAVMRWRDLATSESWGAPIEMERQQVE